MTSNLSLSILATILILVASSCGVQVIETVPTATAFPVTSTLLPQVAPSPSATPPLPAPQPTVAPVEGITATQVNVRAEPSTVGNVLGVLPANTKLEIIGKDPGGNWWQILYPAGAEGKGWVTAQYVTASNAETVPVIGGSAADPNNANAAIVQQQINVRSGPGTSFNSLGTLNPQDVVNLTGKDANGAWLQISFAAGPDGKGWVNAAFVQARGVENLPIITEAGQVIGTGTPTGIPSTPTATVIPAWEDGDSQANPIANVNFEHNGTHILIYSGAISSPAGDSQDWIGFKPYSQMVLVSLTCTGNKTLQVEILENDISMNAPLACGAQMQQIAVKPGSRYSIHLSTAQSTDSLEYFGYTIKIETVP